VRVVSSKKAERNLAMVRMHVEEGESLTAIARTFGVTRERVRQIVVEMHGKTLSADRIAEHKEERLLAEEERHRAFRARVQKTWNTHGTRTRYLYGCRCEECLRENRERMREYRRRRLRER